MLNILCHQQPWKTLLHLFFPCGKLYWNSQSRSLNVGLRRSYTLWVDPVSVDYGKSYPKSVIANIPKGAARFKSGEVRRESFAHRSHG